MRRPSWPRKFPKTTAEFPIFLDYADDVYAAVAEAATAELTEVMSIADKQTREEATETLKTKIVERLAPSSRAARRRSPAPTGR